MHLPFRMVKRTLALYCAASAVVTLATAALADAEKPSAKAIIESVQAYYSGLNDYEASFVQTTAHKLFAGRLQRAYGTMMFRKGGRMRWEYTRPEQKLFVYDGKTLWVYEREVPQIFKGEADAERLSKALAFLTGQGRILDAYAAKLLKSEKFGYQEKGYVLGLVPKEKGSPFSRVELYVSREALRVERSVVVDSEGNRNRIDFIEPTANKGVDEALFSFTPPPGVPIIQPDR